MGRKFIADLADDMTVNDVYLVRQKHIMETRKGKPFLRLVLGDKTGEIAAVKWDYYEQETGRVTVGDFAQVRGRVGVFNNALQLTISDLKVAKPDEYDQGDFLRTSDRDRREMFHELEELIDSVQQPFLARLVRSVFRHDPLRKSFQLAPAAVSNHHNYLGGLMEHTINVCRICEASAKVYPDLDRDLLLVGALLHDIGKTEEYEYTRYIEFSDLGRLVGHHVLGVEMVDRVLAEHVPDFPEELRWRVHHLILSHHGAYEFGSPRRPKFPEAAVLHMADNMDAQYKMLADAQASADPNAHWSEYHRSLERYIYVPPEKRSESKPDEDKDKE